MPKQTYICSNCGKIFSRYATEIRTDTPCCSRACATNFAKPWAYEHHKKPPNTACSVCGKPIKRPPSHLARVEQPVCSYECNGVLRGQEWAQHAHKGRAAWTEESIKSYTQKMTGENNPAWKGGATYRTRKGNYPQSVKYVRCPSEFISMARKDGYVMEHRLIMAQHLGRPLLRSEVVHHIDHDVTNNQLDNLQLFASNGEHKRHEGETGYFKEYYHRTRTSPRSSEPPTDLGLDHESK